MAQLKAAARVDHMFKTLLIGDSGVGKSSMMIRFTESDFNEKQLSTIGVDFRVKMCAVRNSRGRELSCKLAIWDAAGQERFRTITSSYYRGAHAVCAVYDVTDRGSFEHVQFWLGEVEKYARVDDLVLMLVGNKIDLTDGPDSARRQVTRAEGSELASERGMLFIETSAKTSEGIEDCFQEVMVKLLDMPAHVLETTKPVGMGINLKSSESERDVGCSC
jgi:Ras-related protein Rab-18